MIFKIQRKNRDFFQVSNLVVEQPGMSFKAKGVLCYLLSKPESWVPRVGEISSIGPDGRESIQTALQELSKFGFAVLDIDKGDDGKMTGKVWRIYESPSENPTFTDRRVSAPSATDERLSRLTAKPSVGNPDTSNTVERVTPHQEQHSAKVQDPDVRDQLPEEVKPVWDMWQEHLKQKKVRRTPLASKLQVKDLMKMGPERSIAAIEFSIAGNYQSIYEPRNWNQAATKPSIPAWRRIEDIDEKIKALKAEFSVVKDEGARAGIRNEIAMLTAEKTTMSIKK